MLVAVPMAARADGEPVDANNPLYVGVDATAVADVASTSYVKGAYNDAVGKINKVANLKQDKLMNNAASPAAITEAVQTSIRATGTASDTALATEKAVRDAIDSTAGAVGDLSTLAGDYGTGDTGNTAPATVVAALDGIDDRVDTLETTMGTGSLTGFESGTDTVIEALNELESTKQDKTDSTVSSAGNYLTTGTGVGANLQALDTAVGKLSADGNYTAVANSAAQNIAALDTQVKANADAIDDLEADMGDMSTLTGFGQNTDTVAEALNELKSDVGTAKYVTVHTVWNTNTTASADVLTTTAPAQQGGGQQEQGGGE